MITEKVCTKCGIAKPIGEFNKQKGSKDGHRSWCKDCQRIYNRAYEKSSQGKEVIRKRRRTDKVREYTRRYNRKYSQTKTGKKAHEKAQRKYDQTEKGKLARNKNSEIYRKKYPHKKKAQYAVKHAIERGDVVPVAKQICDDCGKQAQHYHHESYAKADWLNVIPLCAKCHKKRHK